LNINYTDWNEVQKSIKIPLYFFIKSVLAMNEVKG